MLTRMLSPVELEIELFCRGMRDRRILRSRRRRPPDLCARAPASGRGSSSSCRLPGSRSGSTSRSSSPSPPRHPSGWCRTTASTTSRDDRAGDVYPVEDSGGARLVLADDVVGRSDEPRRRPAGQLPRRLRLQLVPVLGHVALAAPASSARRATTSAWPRSRARRSRTSSRSRRPRARSRAPSSRTSTPATTSRRSTTSSRSTACGSASPSSGAPRARSAASSASRRCRSRGASSTSTTS